MEPTERGCLHRQQFSDWGRRSQLSTAPARKALLRVGTPALRRFCRNVRKSDKACDNLFNPVGGLPEKGGRIG